MKLFFVVLLVVAASSFASSTLTGELAGRYTIEMPATDDIIDSNAFVSAEMYGTAFASAGDYYMAEDFTPSAKYDITDVTWWMVTTASVPAPSGLEVMFYDDAPPGPGTLLWTGTPSAVEFLDTGYTFAGYVLWQANITLPDTDYFVAEQDQTYWVCIHRTDGSNFFIIADINVEGTECYRIVTAGGPWVAGSTTGYDATDIFQIIQGNPYVALQRETWGSIKSIF
jgi:hypothetical protein